MQKHASPYVKQKSYCVCVSRNNTKLYKCRICIISFLKMLKRILFRIQWRILLYCGIGMWIALCASDRYYGEYNELLLSTDKVFPTTEITHQVAIETDTALISTSNFIEKDHESWSTIRKSRILATFIVIFMSIWSILFVVCVQDYTQKKAERFLKTEYLKQELNSDKETCKNIGIQVSYSSNFISTTLYYDKDEKRSSYNWFSSLESAMNTASYAFKEEKDEHRIIYKNLEKPKKGICNYYSKEYNEYKIERLYNTSYTYQCEPVSPLIQYIYLNRSFHFHSNLFSQRYTISIFNTFSSLSFKYFFNSLPLGYSLKKNDFFDSNSRKESTASKFKILNWFCKKNKEIKKLEYFGKANGYIISSSPEFQQILENFMNIKYMQSTCV